MERAGGCQFDRRERKRTAGRWEPVRMAKGKEGRKVERPGPQAALATHHQQFEWTVAQGAFTYRERKTS